MTAVWTSFPLWTRWDNTHRYVYACEAHMTIASYVRKITWDQNDPPSAVHGSLLTEIQYVTPWKHVVPHGRYKARYGSQLSPPPVSLLFPDSPPPSPSPPSPHLQGSTRICNWTGSSRPQSQYTIIRITLHSKKPTQNPKTGYRLPSFTEKVEGTRKTDPNIALFIQWRHITSKVSANLPLVRWPQEGYKSMLIYIFTSFV